MAHMGNRGMGKADDIRSYVGVVQLINKIGRENRRTIYILFVNKHHGNHDGNVNKKIC